MRKPFMFQILMVVFFVIAHSIASAQSDYVVTIKGDTLKGKIKYYSYSGVKYTNTRSKYIQLTDENGKKSTHEILQTIAFRMNDDIYHTIKFYETYEFMKLIKRGYLSLYGYQMENQTTWDGRYFVKKDGVLLDVPNLGFKKRVAAYLADCPNVVKNIESGVLGKSELLKIVEEYNACVELKTTSKVLKKSPATEAWAKLGDEVKVLPEFDKKADAIEMIQDVQNKLSKNETIPSFLINGLKDSLKDQTSVKETLDEAIGKLN
jgi:hypothetical protein